jgi:hypothetical protein
MPEMPSVNKSSEVGDIPKQSKDKITALYL